jgi:hypothetical protein
MENQLLQLDAEWSNDAGAVALVAELLCKLPELKARGAIDSYTVTDRMIHINLTGSQKRGWFKKGP